MAEFVASSAGWMDIGTGGGGPAGRVRAALGRSGVVPAADKREGDLASPAGAWLLRRVLYRADRGPAPRTALPVSALEPDDGWCDAADDTAYNQPVTHPWRSSAERLWRDDGLYNVVVVLGHNDDPVVPGAGSAIFLHCAAPDWRGTEGCVALAEADLRAFLARVAPGDRLRIAI